MNISKAEFGKSNWNPFSAASKGVGKLGMMATAAVQASALGQQIAANKEEQAKLSREQMEHEVRIKSMDIEHKKFEIGANIYQSNLEAGRRKSFQKATLESAEPGTAIKTKAGEYSSEFTKKKERPVAVAAKSLPVQAKPKGKPKKRSSWVGGKVSKGRPFPKKSM